MLVERDSDAECATRQPVRLAAWVSDVTAGSEDLKIITLARSSRARVAASEGAAVRDETGRTYTAAAVALPSLRLSALRLAVAMAVSSGAQKLEAAALVSDAELDPGDLAAVRDLGPDATVFHAAPDGTVRADAAVLRPRQPHRCRDAPSSPAPPRSTPCLVAAERARWSSAPARHARESTGDVSILGVGAPRLPLRLRLPRRPPERRQVDADATRWSAPRSRSPATGRRPPGG